MAMSKNISSVPMRQRFALCPASHGNPKGCCRLRTGHGPLLLEYNRRLCVLHGGLTITRS
eukprot:4704851-Heterocapsa_arctica.AAC.1